MVFVIGSIAWVGLYRFMTPPATVHMVMQARQQGELNREWRSIDSFSPLLIQSVIVAEDQKFCSHWGFDFEAIEQARQHNNGDNGSVRGASTLSMQTAKNAFLWPGRNFIRKGLEAWFTLLMELLWPKSRILEVYLNVAEWGPGVFGAEAAAEANFGHGASRLTRTEAARLAAILPSPRKWSARSPGPYVERRSAEIRRQTSREGPALAHCVSN